MSDNKKYYYIKIKESFFEGEDIKILQSLENGYLYSDILMKLYLKSLKNNGRLMFKEHIPYNTKMISTITGHNIVMVEKALDIFKELGLIEILDNGAIYMLDIQLYIGQGSTEGDRKKEFRMRIEREKQRQLGVGQMSDKCPPEIDIDTEIDKNIEIDIDIEEIIESWNKVSNNKATNTEKRQDKIATLIKEFGVNKILETINKIPKSRYLLGQINGQTIKIDWFLEKDNFVNVMENFYTDVALKKTNNLRFNNFEARTYDYDLLEKKLLGWED